jgi:proteasome assembly chaperone (PAC2) family protein
VDERLRLHVHPTLEAPVLLLAFEGWNDAGEAATLAARAIARTLGAVPLAELDAEDFYDFTVQRPRVELSDGGLRRIEWPRNRFLLGSLDSERELVVGWGAEPHLRWRTFSRLMLELARTLGVRRVVLLGAYLSDVVYSRPVPVTGFASAPELLARLGVEPSAYEGPTGIVGVLAEAFRGEGIEVLSLWASLPHYVDASPNPRGALALVEKLSECLDCKLDDGALRAQATEFEQRISDLISRDPELSDYVRELKRRDFAQ